MGRFVLNLHGYHIIGPKGCYVLLPYSHVQDQGHMAEGHLFFSKTFLVNIYVLEKFVPQLIFISIIKGEVSL